jgi:small subunit ribosomal protein S20
LANTKSALKEIRVARARRERNKSVQSEVKSVVRASREQLASNDSTSALEALHKAESKLDKAAGKGIIHPNAAARRKSRLAKQLNKISSK